MDEDQQWLHRRSRTNPQSIPLQDLGQLDEESSEGPGAGATPHRRTLSEHGRRLFASSASRRHPSRYSPLPDANPSNPPRSSLRVVPQSTSAESHHTFLNSSDQEDAAFSPLEDRAGFQSALGFAGLSFEAHDHASTSYQPRGLPALAHGNDSSATLAVTGDELDDGGPPDLDNDTAPLTQNAASSVPSSTFLSPPDQRSGRQGPQAVRFSMDDQSPKSSRLGDDLSDAERGSHGRSRSASHVTSLSPTSDTPLHRASTIVRKMSQRVVNISNEPELAQQEIARRRSARRADAEGRAPSPGRPSTTVSREPENPFVDGEAAEQPEKPVFKAEVVERRIYTNDWVAYDNPLRGRSLGIFPPSSPIRTRLCNLLVHPFTEPFILILIIIQTVLLAVDAAPNVFNEGRPTHFGATSTDWTLLAIFSVYTVEIAIRMIVSGFIVNPIEYSTIERGQGLKQAVAKKAGELFAVDRKPSVHQSNGLVEPAQRSVLRTFTNTQAYAHFSPDDRHKQRYRLAHRAFLRHSFNRLDFLAIVSFWISFFLSLAGIEHSHQLYVFRMLSCLRILRLLSLTAGTSIILRSLKKAAPLLLNVALLTGFFWLLFAVIGVQSFKSSLRRYCVWIDPTGQQGNYTNNQEGQFGFCGGSTAGNGTVLPWYHADGTQGDSHKGFLCPVNSLCIESSNPYNGTVSFDNIVQSLELVFVVISSNTYTDLMYYMTNTDYLAAALFFAGGIVVLTLWLVSLLIAVITTSFQIIREESQYSAFAAHEAHDHISLEDKSDEESTARRSTLRVLYSKTEWFWIAVIVYDTLVQCLRSYGMDQSREAFINTTELVVTLVLLLEILFRFVCDFRHFFKRKRNIFDLFLAIATSILQIPSIKNSGAPYAWLSVFQIMRLYRVVLAVPITRDLIVLVLGNVSGIANLMLFVVLLNFLVSILASQLFRGQIPLQNPSNQNDNQVTFQNIWNSFLGVYQIYSSENWTSILYNITQGTVAYNTAWVGAMFCILWFILGFFIVFNMFIAVIQENFDVDEDEKRLHQVKAFLQERELGSSSTGVMSLSSMFRLRSLAGKRQDPLDYGSAMTSMLLKETVVRDFLQDEGEDDANDAEEGSDREGRKRPVSSLSQSIPIGTMWTRVKRFVWDSEPNPFYSSSVFDVEYGSSSAKNMARQVASAQEERKRAQRDYLRRHPTYNTSLCLFKPDNKLRRACQKLVGPGRGSVRIEGASPSPVLWYAFSAILYAAIVAMVLLACITTPLYQKEYFQSHTYSVRNWFVFTDMAFAAIFTAEAIIRTVADGAFMTPHAYFRSSWGLIDGIVLVTLWIDVTTSLYNEGAISRAVGAFKALRALRLLNVSDSARDTFHSVIVRGGWKVISAAFVSLSLLIPFAIWGLNLFNGQMYGCNDGNSGIVNLKNCVNEYSSTPFNWEVLAPRQAANQWYNFDNFGSSLFVLFEITSLEGWIDVMFRATSITGTYSQPSMWNSPGNAVFFVVFNLLGSVFVLTLFVSVFMRNYTEQTGVAFLTSDQRSWLEMRKLLRQVAPSKRPSPGKKRRSWQQWCYFRAIRKTGRWQRFMTAILLLHLVLLCLEYYPEPAWWEITRDTIFFILTLFYVANVFIRLIGLTWRRFRRSAWDVYSLFSVFGTLITTTLLFVHYDSRIYLTLHKLFLVSVVLLLIPRNNQLDQLFKTAAASLANIANLLATWFVLFLVFAIALTQTFGLTRFGSQESGNINFRDVPKALILLFRMSTGEGWDQIMIDYATATPPFCTEASIYFDSDCGSGPWANVLFVAWNVLSMYIFVNMFISLIYESFSYVYQRSSTLPSIRRTDIRRFKEAWAAFDPDGKGYITKEQFPRLVGELTDIFEMRIYPQEFSVRSLVEKSKKQQRPGSMPFDDKSSPYEIDLTKLNDALKRLPVDEIRARRMRMNIFYEEVMVSADPDRGISFSMLLMILAHYKIIKDNKSLRLEEFLRRRARLQRVQEAVRRAVVVSFFDTLFNHRRFRRFIDSKNIRTVPQLSVPEIFVEDEDEAHERSSISPHPSLPQILVEDEDRPSELGTAAPAPSHRPALSLQIPTFSSTAADDSADATGSDSRSTVGSATHRRRASSIQISPVESRTRQSISPPGTPRLSIDQRLGNESRRNSDDAAPVSPASERRQWESRQRQDSTEHGSPRQMQSRSRGTSNVSALDVLDVFESSAWGESVRRSMTAKRGRASGSSRGESKKGGKSPRRSASSGGASGGHDRDSGGIP